MYSEVSGNELVKASVTFRFDCVKNPPLFSSPLSLSTVFLICWFADLSGQFLDICPGFLHLKQSPFFIRSFLSSVDIFVDLALAVRPCPDVLACFGGLTRGRSLILVRILAS